MSRHVLFTRSLVLLLTLLALSCLPVRGGRGGGGGDDDSATDDDDDATDDDDVTDDDDDVTDDDDDVTDDDDAGGCDEGLVEDCNDVCSPAEWIGDEICDDGSSKEADFDCADFDFDGGDCKTGDDDDATPPPDDDDTSGECDPKTEVEDCNDVCAPIEWIGDTYCDDMAYEYEGNMIDLNCEEFEYDGGDCPAP